MSRFAARLGRKLMKKPAHHVFVCGSFRVNGAPQGTCNKLGSMNLMQYFEEEIGDRGIDAAVSGTSCLKLCDRGPAVIVYPENWWYGHIDSEDAVDAVLDSIEKGVPDPDHLLA
jgi:(2Fe-2S) ferredoxin